VDGYEDSFGSGQVPGGVFHDHQNDLLLPNKDTHYSRGLMLTIQHDGLMLLQQ